MIEGFDYEPHKDKVLNLVRVEICKDCNYQVNEFSGFFMGITDEGILLDACHPDFFPRKSNIDKYFIPIKYLISRSLDTIEILYKDQNDRLETVVLDNQVESVYIEGCKMNSIEDIIEMINTIEDLESESDKKTEKTEKTSDSDNDLYTYDPLPYYSSLSDKSNDKSDITPILDLLEKDASKITSNEKEIEYNTTDLQNAIDEINKSSLTNNDIKYIYMKEEKSYNESVR